MSHDVVWPWILCKGLAGYGANNNRKNPERAQEAVKPDMHNVAWCRGSSELSMLHFHAA